MNHQAKFISDVQLSSFYTFDHWLGLGETCRVALYIPIKTCIWAMAGEDDCKYWRAKRSNGSFVVVTLSWYCKKRFHHKVESFRYKLADLWQNDIHTQLTTITWKENKYYFNCGSYIFQEIVLKWHFFM